MRAKLFLLNTIASCLVPFFALPVEAELQVELKRITGGFTLPVHVAGVPGSTKLAVVEQAGKIRVVDPMTSAIDTYLDLTAKVTSGGEKGLLSVAFHPQFSQNGKLYVDYTADESGLKTIIAEFHADRATGKVDPMTERRLLVIAQPYSNHNGGQLAFGPDGMLYIGMGDGGSRMDPQGNGQSLQTLLGKMLRIDVDHGAPYLVPKDNPFVERAGGARGEIWAYGLRNPWRFSFDRRDGTLWAGDVGQDGYEEIDIIRRGGNYGWSVYEANHCMGFQVNCLRSGFEAPVAEYGRDLGQSVTGGFVYRGNAFPEMQGVYFYADYMSGRIWGLRQEGGKVVMNEPLLKSELHFSSFGEGADGELFIVSHQSGEIFQLVQRISALA